KLLSCSERKLRNRMIADKVKPLSNLLMAQEGRRQLRWRTYVPNWYLRRLGVELPADSQTHRSPERRQATNSGGRPPNPMSPIDRMRKAIEETNIGRNASPKALLNSARIQRGKGIKALRELERLGEYSGFDRSQRS